LEKPKEDETTGQKCLHLLRRAAIMKANINLLRLTSPNCTQNRDRVHGRRSRRVLAVLAYTVARGSAIAPQIWPSIPHR